MTGWAQRQAELEAEIEALREQRTSLKEGWREACAANDELRQELSRYRQRIEKLERAMRSAIQLDTYTGLGGELGPIAVELSQALKGTQ